MTSHISHVMTLANSIIGVSVLAMPFCFKQCGIILAIIVLLLCSLLSRLACHFLIKSAVMSRRRNFEFLAFHAFGHMGKFFVELFIIGFLLGTCIAFFVVIGDLGPQIIGKMLNKSPEDIRTSFLLTTGALIVLPLGLLKNIDSLATICTATIGFYFCLVLKVIIESTNHIFTGDWQDKVNYWRPAGILQCLPIFSMALFCQTQLFEIYESIPNVSLEKMNLVVREALNICTMVYLCVGFFGYVAFCTEPFSGNILMIFEPSATSDMIKIGFVLSVVFSFPLVIFPCRASLNSLLFKRVHTHEQANNYIPETRFRCLTFTIVIVALITGILMPNIEFVLGLVGSTIGVMICLILPATCFIVISPKNTNERLLAQVISFIGIWIMILGTYANLYAMEEASTLKININTEKPLVQVNNIELNLIKVNDKLLLPEAPLVPLIQQKNIELIQSNFKIDVGQHPDVENILHDPPIPPIDKSIKDVEKVELVPQKIEIIAKPEMTLEKAFPNSPGDTKIVEEKIKQDQQANEILINSEVKKNEEAGVAHANGKISSDSNGDQNNQIFQKLEEHKDEIRKLMEEQKVILQDIEHHKEELELEKRKRLKYKEQPNESKIINLSSDKLYNLNNEIPQKVESNDKIEATKVDDKHEKNAPNLNENSVNLKISKNVIFNKTDNLTNSNGKLMNITSIESRGPIVDVLTNWTVTRKSQDANNISSTKNQSKSVINKIQMEEVKKTINRQLPIPLKLINQTKERIPDDGNEKSEILKKDISKENNRDKREIQSKFDNPTFIDNEQDLLIINESTRDKIEIVKNSLEKKELNDENNVEYKISKKRDLKSLKFSGNL